MLDKGVEWIFVILSALCILTAPKTERSDSVRGSVSATYIRRQIHLAETDNPPDLATNLPAGLNCVV